MQKEIKNNNDLFYKAEIVKDVAGIEMGVLENGTPFLSQAGLTELCGLTTNGLISKLGDEWQNDRLKKHGRNRLNFVKEYLDKKDYKENTLYFKIKKNGREFLAYPDIVCFAILEYYAFESDSFVAKARDNFRMLASHSFKEFIYKATGYNPQIKKLNKWRYYLDRIDLNLDKPPIGYFSIFQEMAQMIHSFIKNGLIVIDKTIPDTSVCQFTS
ncbi:MAG: hypothetical protein ACTSXL_05540 [Alphaproteobacteria bacterium]|nr:MAG: hypothetical protein B6I23_02485 [Rickettsiaceae bacterium 4572_127]